MPSTQHSGGTTKRGRSRFGFISETLAELKKVTWLTRREAAYLTLLVLVVAASVGVVLGLIDLGFSELVNLLLGG
jgi:preprotein translocase subunit SecE